MKIIQLSDVPVLEPAKNGYWEIYDDGSKIWHKNECPQNNKMRLKPPSDYIIPNQDVKTGDLITFLDEGKYNTLPQDPDREVLTFKVETPSGEEKSISINKTSQIELIKAWTDESSKWVGKKATVKIVNQKVFKEFKDVIYLFPAEGKVASLPPEELPEDEA
ncbi:MAG TPA: hypothetical protein VMV95_01065 [Bacillota bacterium]|nr:hypothetical protein [Bacillota bacterium]